MKNELTLTGMQELNKKEMMAVNGGESAMKVIMRALAKAIYNAAYAQGYKDGTVNGSH